MALEREPLLDFTAPTKAQCELGNWTLVWSIAVLYRGKRAVILHVCCLLHFIILLEEAAIESLIAAEEQERCLLVSVTLYGLWN